MVHPNPESFPIVETFRSQTRSPLIAFFFLSVGNPLDCQKIKWMTELKSNFLSISKATCQFDNSLHELGALKELVALMPDQPAASTVHQVGRLFASTNTKNTKNDTSTNDSSSSVLVCPNWSLLTLTWILNLIWLL